MDLMNSVKEIQRNNEYISKDNKDNNISAEDDVLGLLLSESENGTDDEVEIHKHTIKKIKKHRVNLIVDSDEDADDNAITEEVKQSPVDNEVEEQLNNENSTSKVHRLRNWKRMKKEKNRAENISDSNDEETVNQRISTLSDSDNEQLNSISENEKSGDELKKFTQPESKGCDKATKNARASAKKALDQMKPIQSEQQRLHREAHISVPYHKPKKHTLEEFLQRRTIIKPELTSESCSPAAAAVQKKSLKMTSEELEEYANLMEERAKECSEFFKSESDEEIKHNEYVYNNKSEENHIHRETEIKETNQTECLVSNEDHIDTEMKVETTAKESLQENSTSEKENVNVVQQLTEADLEEILQDEKPSKSPYLITEIIELPKVDLNTLNITPPTKKLSSINIKDFLEKNQLLSSSPTLHGDSSKFIDLDTGDLIEKKPSGADHLMRRLMATMKKRDNAHLKLGDVASTKNDQLEMTQKNKPLITRESKPGEAYFELKRNLKEILKKKRLEELQKKQEEREELEQNKKLNDELELDEMCSESDEEELNEEEENDIWVDEEENVHIESDDELNKGNDEEIDEIEKSDCSDNNEDEEHVSKNRTPKTRIIKAFNDSSSDNDDEDFLKTQPLPSPSPRENNDEEMSLSDDMAKSEKPIMALMSQIPMTQNGGQCTANMDEELMQLCSGSFQTQIQSQNVTPNNEQFSPNPTCNKIYFSDEEDSISCGEGLHTRQKKLTKKLNKKRTKLGFSDDEEDSSSGSEEEMDNVSVKECSTDQIQTNHENVEDEKDQATTYIDYDSEENEIVVEMTKNEYVKQAEKFLEKEAELSETEWDSADEDEKNLDRYDVELGDEDEFDQEKMRQDLGKIHARKMLDQDIREMRKFQEIFLDDKEQEGQLRQRQFRWSNSEATFTLEDPRYNENDEGYKQEEENETNEQHWRKLRYEREQFLKEHKTACHTSYNETLLTSKKLQIISDNKKICTNTSADVKLSSSFLITKGISTAHRKSVRGSFLVRDKEILNKLAGTVKDGVPVASQLHDTTIKSIKPKNFVFTSITAEERQHLKRKTSDTLNNKEQQPGVNYIKRSKLEPRRDKCLIDQLL